MQLPILTALTGLPCQTLTMAWLVLCLSLAQSPRAWSESSITPGDGPGADTRSDDKAPRELSERFSYGNKGLAYQHGETDLWLGLRFQTRYDSFKGDIATLETLQGPQDSGLDLRRGRIKGGGSVGASWFRVYSEYDFESEALLDLRATATWDDWLSFRVGQWKSEFSRERIDSSGKQQFVERSIANYWFTVDRQLAAAVSPRLAAGTRADTRLYLEWLSGRGRGASFDGDFGLLLARLQWGPAGEELPFSQSDLKRRNKAVPSITIAGISGDSPHTRFSSSGGGNLPGYEQGDYRLRQLMLETAVHYRGLSWQQELHWKEIHNNRGGDTRELWGGYAQLGSFLNVWWSAVPAPLEIVGRYARVDPETVNRNDKHQEYTVAANWYFNGHRNKLTFDYALLDYQEGSTNDSETRWRLQWELSL